MSANSVMPQPIKLGEHLQTTILAPHHNWEESGPDPLGRRTVMGYPLPSWQRGLVWTEAQMVRLLESAWRGLSIGTYTINQSPQYRGEFDGILIDGQQRLYALQCYFEGKFPVYGYTWQEVTEIDRRGFLMGRHFSSYITRTDDEQYLRDYYNLMNFGGVAHTDDQRA